MKNLSLIGCGTIAVCLTVAGLLTGCGSTHVDSPVQERLDSMGVVSNVLRAKNIDYTVRIGLIIDAAADSIINESNDPAIKQNARQWRSYVLPGIRHALSFSDPALAALDGWAFAVQQRMYLSSGGGKAFFGSQQDIAVRASHSIERVFSADRIFEDESESIQTKIESWANDHPIQNSLFARESIIPSVEALKFSRDENLTSSVGQIAHDLRNITNRLSLYTTQLPREIRWQGEYLLEELRLQSRLDSMNALVSVMVSAVDRLTNTVNDGDLVVDVHGLQQLRADIVALKQQISTERELLMADVNRQRVETLREVEGMSRQLLSEFRTPAKVLVDYVLFRAMIAMVIVILVTVAIVFWVRRRAT